MAPALSASMAAGPALNTWRLQLGAAQRLGERAVGHAQDGGGVGDIGEVAQTQRAGRGDAGHRPRNGRRTTRSSPDRRSGGGATGRAGRRAAVRATAPAAVSQRQRLQLRQRVGDEKRVHDGAFRSWTSRSGTWAGRQNRERRNAVGCDIVRSSSIPRRLAVPDGRRSVGDGTVFLDDAGRACAPGAALRAGRRPCRRPAWCRRPGRRAAAIRPRRRAGTPPPAPGSPAAAVSARCR